LEDPTYAGLLTQEFSAVVPENAMKFEVIHPEPDRYDFSQADAIVDFAMQNGLKVRGHPLVWGSQLPAWVVQGEYTREQWIEILRQHIQTVVGHFRDANGGSSVYAWDVVNEAVGLEGELYQNFWLEVIGPEYIPLAFQFAHEADPQALLFYNDNGGEGLDAKANGIYNLVQGLIGQGIPIHGVGLQMHTGPGWPPTGEDFLANIQRLAELGLQVQITEMDVRIQDTPGDRDQQLESQAQRYAEVMAACLQVPSCTAFLTWGLTDRYSWIPGHTGNPDAPLLFDENFQPKPALFKLLDLLQQP
jgi:endo-1,4-beta-xylanase